jgi:uncharacterized protein YjbI with pentapeptide repeats
MKIIKPQSLGILHKPYPFQGQHYFAIAAIGFFRLGAENARFLTANLQWKHVKASLPSNQPLDEVMPKLHAEALLAGNAHSPGKAPCTQMQVQLCVSNTAGTASIAKCLCVYGDRQWRNGVLARRKVSPPQPFTSMPLDYSRAFGGPADPVNPVGCGDRNRLFGPTEGKMPNITYPEQIYGAAWRRSIAAGFGPIRLGNAARLKKFGTYKTPWLEQDAPGFARDMDWSVFNLAPPDQWAKEFFQGGEAYRLHNMHPDKPLITGQLPRLQARAFLLQDEQTPDQASEVALTMDTVWFFPEHELGVVIYHGKTTIRDSDALDVKTLMIGYDDPAAPKSLAHYRSVMALRMDKATAAMHVYNESQLAAAHSPAELARRALEQEEAERASLAKSQKRLDLLDAQTWAARGIAPPADHVAPRATLPVLGLMRAQTALEGDFDLSDMMAKAKALTAEVQAKGAAALAKAAAATTATASAIIPVVDPARQLAAAIERAALPAYDLLPAGQTGCEPQVAHMLAALESKNAAGGFASPKDYAAARQAALNLPAVRRQGRRAAPSVTLAALPLLPTVARQLGAEALRWLHSGVCLAGRDLAGADLAGADFCGADLREIMLEGADLTGAKFIGANLQGAVLTGAKLDGANFSNANLNKASLSASSGEAICFQAADLSYVQALSACWPHANLRHANLQRILGIKLDVRGACLDDVQACKATLVELMADDSSWQRAVMVRTVLLKAHLQRSDLRAACLTKTVFNDAQLQNSRWEGAVLEHVQGGGGTDWRGAVLAGIQAKNCGFHGALFAGADLRQAKFFRCDFGDCNFEAARMDHALLSYVLLFNTKLHRVNAEGAEFFQALCRKADFSGANLFKATFARCELSEAIGADCKTARERKIA